MSEAQEILCRWTEYCSELYNYESYGDNAVLDCNQPPEDLQPILREEVETVVAALKKGKFDNIPAELDQAGRETITGVLTDICNRENGLPHGFSR